MILDAKGALCLAEAEFGSKWCLIRNKLPVAIDFTGIFNAQLEGFLICNENVSNVHFGDRKLSLWAFTLSSEVEG